LFDYSKYIFIKYSNKTSVVVLIPLRIKKEKEKNMKKELLLLSLPALTVSVQAHNSVERLIPSKTKSVYNNIIAVDTTIRKKVNQIIIDRLGVEESQIRPEASFTDDLGADSLDTVELIMEFESAFNISIPDKDAEKVKTVEDVYEYLEAKLQQ